MSDLNNITLIIAADTEKNRTDALLCECKKAGYDNIIVSADADGAEKGNTGLMIKNGIKQYAGNSAASGGGFAVVLASSGYGPAGIKQCTKDMYESGHAVTACRSGCSRGFTGTFMHLLCGVKARDVHSGLRVFPSSYSDELMHVPGKRRNWLTDMFIHFKKNDLDYDECVCDPENTAVASDGYRPFYDNLLSFILILKFVASSMISSALDLGVFWILNATVGSAHFGAQFILIDTVIARIISSLVNFTINKKAVFANGGDVKSTLLRYYTLAVPQMLISGGSVKLISYALSASASWQETLIKLPVDIILFFISYRIQQNWVFKEKKDGKKTQRDI